ncbi:hypothetical protein WR25_26888 [Diploscapter pachys]|uniref:Tyrosine-protein kinase ephrin type A/B receptor-like domain-containing protein n=1 Tax=Diploscapter pachys TaxID=2018661 RepID=A0A2A2J6L5_9BILA|nr:hypothetical protein WR25_26888 [Diploscapter pachys]
MKGMIRLLLSSLLFGIGLGRECGQNDYEFTYTSCDEAGQRWRVAVPKAGSNCEGGLPQPQKGLNCSFSCKPGRYLDIETQQCRPCDPGRYSLGGGIRFEEFVTLPEGFSVENFDPSAGIFSDSSSSSSSTKTVCPLEAGWVVRDDVLLYIPTPCISRLSYQATLVRPGFVEFVYRMPRNNRALSLQVDVRNQQCQSYRDALEALTSKYSKARTTSKEESRNGEWITRRVELRTGSNVISWTISNSQAAAAQYFGDPILVDHIDVLGLAFVRECVSCPPGTYSPRGAATCNVCDAGYFAPKGSAQCGRCPQSQYSGPKAAMCIDRPPCKASDYYPVTEPCLNGSTRIVYKKVQPAVCRDDVIGAVAKPEPSPYKPCPKCNSGMAKGKDGVCAFCPKDHFSDGNECKRCPVDTVPNYGFQYSQWETLPPNLSTKCEYMSDEIQMACNVGDAWLPSGSALTSAPSLQRGIALELIIDIPEGFWNPLAPTAKTSSIQAPLAQLTVVLETSCQDPSCVIYIIEDTSANYDSKEGFYRFLAAYNGTQQRRVWSHGITKHNPARFLLAFLRSGASRNEDSMMDVARIYSINVTNVGHKNHQGGGASQCLPCPHSNGEGCVPCPNGHYIDSASHTCMKCPENTIVNGTSDRIGAGVCIPCGEGLKTTDGVSCTTDGHLQIKRDNDTLDYDLSPWVNKNWTTSGVRVFAREGASYFHNFLLAPLGGSVKCEEQFDSTDITGFSDQTKDVVEGAACRLTALPTVAGNQSRTILISPLLLATRLEAITTSRERNGWKLTDKMLEYEGLDKAAIPMDVQLWYETIGSPSDVCPKGNILVVTARCQPTKKTFEACPVCNEDDYDTIKGECLDGHQTIHLIPKKHCVLSGKGSESKSEACSVLSATQRTLLVCGATALIGLSVTLIFICRRNRKLEYKYTRLVESRTGELPVAETCGIESDDEDETADRVIFAKGRERNGKAASGGRDRDTRGVGSRSIMSKENDAFISLDSED